MQVILPLNPNPNPNLSYLVVEDITQAILLGLPRVATAALQVEGSVLVLDGSTVPRCVEQEILISVELT